MAKWKYKTSIIDLNAVIPPEKIACVETGMCMIDNVPGAGLDTLESLLDTEGKDEWELVQCQPHGGKLLCVWKKEQKEAFAS
ncbi:MAG: hypothetical protein JW884_14050 [Deltaproteobacteria bacterium]|nr:hypothetical protein [Deltaproteobacteria bacterium]